MEESQATRPSLLIRISDGRDAEAWAEFVEIYSPFVYRLLRRRGLQEADAADVAQETLRTVFRSIHSFRRGSRKGSFRSWLKMVVRSRVSDFLSQRGKEVPGSGGTKAVQLLHEQPLSDDDDIVLEQEYQQCLFEWAAGKVRPQVTDSTWQAFWQTYVEHRNCQQVAESLGMKVEAVYMARSRVLARLKELIRQVED